MKLLVFAHIPPPHHGQSYMVQLMLQGFGGDRRKGRGLRAEPGAGQGGEANAGSNGAALGIDCYHVNARVSSTLEDVGDFRLGKLVLLLGYCLEAIWVRFRYGVTNFYYVPAPGKPSALYRDWLVMLLCRPFFKRVVLHWHAAGLGKWLETAVQMRTRDWTYRLMKQADLSIVLSEYNRHDAEKLLARRIAVAGNGIPDPCPDFEQRVLPARQQRFAARRKLLAGESLTAAELEACGNEPHLFRVLFLAHCTRQKGVFDAVEGVAMANRKLAATGSPLRVQLNVAGQFIDAGEQAEFERRVAQADLQDCGKPLVIYKGFVSGQTKNRLFEESDCFCFPTYFYAENLPLVIVEATAYGLPVVTTRWRSLPELLPPGDAGLVQPKDPGAVAQALLKKLTEQDSLSLREHFLRHFTLDRFLGNLADAMRAAE